MIEVKKFDIKLKLDFQLDKDEIAELNAIKKYESEQQNYGKDENDNLTNLENIGLIKRDFSEPSEFYFYWSLTTIGEKLLEKYSFGEIVE